MFYENSFVVPTCTPKLQGIDQNYLSGKTFTLYTDLSVSAVICRLDFPCFVGIHICTFNMLSG